MSNSILKEEMKSLVEKMDKQYKLLEEKIKSVNCMEAANDPSLYEKFMPIIEQYQDDLTYISTEACNIIEKLNETLSNMFDSVEKELEILDDSIVEDNVESENIIIDDTNEDVIIQGSLIETKITYKDE
jgi:hypothetical protein